MPLKGSENALAEALYKAATGSSADSKTAWELVAKVILDHITTNSLVTGTAPSGGGPIVEGKIT